METNQHNEPAFGPWIGVPKDRQTLCAVKDCEAAGVFANYCPADRGAHHHGCVHYKDVVGHGLTFRDGSWGLLCAAHLRQVEKA